MDNTSKASDLILTEDNIKACLRDFTTSLSIYPRASRREILSAMQYAQSFHEGQKRDSGEPYIVHPIKTAEILIDLEMDSKTIASSLLHDVLEDTRVSPIELEEKFGTEIYTLVDGVTKIRDISQGRGARNAESIRKMVWAMVQDLRVIIIKLADKCHNMQTLHHISDEVRRKRIARECLDIYAPMADKLGIHTLKSQLEDFSFKFIKPQAYEQINRHISTRTGKHGTYFDDIHRSLKKAASKARIKVAIEARIKNHYSIYKKMKALHKGINEIYDYLGMRIVCDSSESCYMLLGIIHSLGIPLEGRFKDYIACPKSNGYQSLHTTIITRGGYLLEFQIRDQKMHETAEFGIASHWKYKDKKHTRRIRPEDIDVVKKIQTLSEETEGKDAQEFLEVIKRDVLRNSIIVYTPKGDPIELPEGSTGIDMAYHIHSQIGEHCVGVKADDKNLPLTHSLQNAQTVEILTAPNAHPHINWLKHVRSTRARNNIRAWLNHHDTNILIDRNIVAKHNASVKIRPNDNRISISKCCAPSPGHHIVGYVSGKHGIIVHEAACPNLVAVKDLTEKLIDVEWETKQFKSTHRLVIHAQNTHNLFGRIEGVIRTHGAYLVSGAIDETDRGEIDGSFTIDLDDMADLDRIMQSIKAIPAVNTVGNP